jgi:preprotein translocase subunit SecE
MATEEELEKQTDEAAEDAETSAAAEPAEPAPKSDSDAPDASAEGSSEDDGGTPVQLGYTRYVYAAYMAGAMLVAFLVAKIGHVGWYRLGQWKPELGEPQDEIVYPVAGLLGVLVAVYYWRKPEARQYADEVAEELSKVTWPSRKEVTNSTTVVVLATLFATVFFALMDRFWGYVTDHIYSF